MGPQTAPSLPCPTAETLLAARAGSLLVNSVLPPANRPCHAPHCRAWRSPRQHLLLPAAQLQRPTLGALCRASPYLQHICCYLVLNYIVSSFYYFEKSLAVSTVANAGAWA